MNDISNMRALVTIQRKIQDRDEFGAYTAQWTDLFKLRGELKLIGGNKTVNNNEVFNTQQCSLIVYNRGILDTDRVIYNNNKYKILYIEDLGLNQFQKLIIEKINS